MLCLGPKQTDLIQSELTNIIRVAMQKGQSCFLIHFELVGLFDPLTWVEYIHMFIVCLHSLLLLNEMTG
jgi:hypothetical protein